jgi:hypothetical protein
LKKTGCGKIKVISSIAELEKLSGKKIADVHKPYIDDVSWDCECGGTMRRVPEVLDLHVLGAPPAFTLSQDQTLRVDPSTSPVKEYRGI